VSWVVVIQSRKVNDTFITNASGRSQVFIHHVEQARGGGRSFAPTTACWARGGRAFQPKFDRKLIFFFSLDSKS